MKDKDMWANWNNGEGLDYTDGCTRNHPTLAPATAAAAAAAAAATAVPEHFI
jgi:hypothetical protein